MSQVSSLLSQQRLNIYFLTLLYIPTSFLYILYIPLLHYIALKPPSVIMYCLTLLPLQSCWLPIYSFTYYCFTGCFYFFYVYTNVTAINTIYYFTLLHRSVDPLLILESADPYCMYVCMILTLKKCGYRYTPSRYRYIGPWQSRRMWYGRWSERLGFS